MIALPSGVAAGHTASSMAPFQCADELRGTFANRGPVWLCAPEDSLRRARSAPAGNLVPQGAPFQRRPSNAPSAVGPRPRTALKQGRPPPCR